MTDHAVVIAGGGPTGLMLAAELRLAGVDALVVERRASQELDGSRAGGLHPRTLEVLDQRGVVERFVAEGQPHPFAGYATVSLDISDFPTRHPYVLALWQRDFERILAGWVLDELDAPIRRGCDVIGCTTDAGGVDVQLSDGATLRADYVVGCDGGRSVVRKTAGIDFVGLDPSTSWIIAEVDLDDTPEVGLRRGGGIGPVDRVRGGNPYRIALTETEAEHATDPTVEDLRGVLVDEFGTDLGIRRVHWISRFTDASRQAATYRRGRVLVAGDAAHVHPPQGGQGLNVGVQDAVNLGWKLAQVVRGVSSEDLLDTYHDERHPIAARVLQNTSAAVAIGTPDERHAALRATFAELLGMDEPRRRIAGMITGLDVRYDLGDGHPLLGRRMPDLDLTTAGGPTRVSPLLHEARPVLVNLGRPGSFERTELPARLRVVDATPDGTWELPVIGPVPAPDAVLIRPDGHVAWVGAPHDTSLTVAATRWFGAARPIA
jgi:2-polyprenyl-6-methoxyphenol hydroxylase-like FAD-dependent oxidoreductase